MRMSKYVLTKLVLYTLGIPSNFQQTNIFVHQCMYMHLFAHNRWWGTEYSQIWTTVKINEEKS